VSCVVTIVIVVPRRPHVMHHSSLSSSLVSFLCCCITGHAPGGHVIVVVVVVVVMSHWHLPGTSHCCHLHGAGMDMLPLLSCLVIFVVLIWTRCCCRCCVSVALAIHVCQDRFFTDLISMRGLGVRGWPSGKTKMLRSIVVLPE